MSSINHFHVGMHGLNSCSKNYVLHKCLKRISYEGSFEIKMLRFDFSDILHFSVYRPIM